ncbi:membrane dipeptidase [Paenibacillus sp. SYP-B3998]|uniref:Membrane dipeptidase n=1 Tax=Paenibacillus sp. SYP-B3998 TaxID=2678564 RepID=A0A6G3ZTT5_9BACL|nr:dipeptidase [Paenibacillus sp. SYP-B3998]NEW05626.1 membrane dipeptidase [Paenibacillus sp. SYP-B3998]
MDGHCDALTKLYLNPELNFHKEEVCLEVNYPRLQRAGVKVQCFAIYISEKIQAPSFEHVLQMIDVFHRKILSHKGMAFIQTVSDWLTVEKSDKIGAVLTLEGLDALAGNMTHLRILYHLGVRSIGLTWNYANWAADGVQEPRKGGFTLKGKHMLRELEAMGIIVDVSHLSEKAFWELVELYRRPFIASHSNAGTLCPHPRNLSDEQIKTIIECHGQIGITFVPYFVKSGNSPVQISQLLTHIDHVCSLGGEKHVGFGSDFDGIEQWIVGLEHAGQYENIIEALCKNYKEEQVERFLYGNWRKFMLSHLPK